ncbi:TPA: hypothetical protein ACVU5E_004713 [Vibrio parahaemolyticus]
MLGKETISLVALVLSFFGFILAFNQYRKTQKWKKSEFAAQHLDKLRENEQLALAVMLLDWEGREIVVPKDYKHLTDDSYFVHDRFALESAMLPMNEAPDETHPTGYSWQDCIYRDTFDALFSYLELTEHFIENQLISARDIKPLAYILKQVQGSNQCGYTGFIEYTKKYDFHGVTKLIQKFEKEKLF